MTQDEVSAPPHQEMTMEGPGQESAPPLESPAERRMHRRFRPRLRLRCDAGMPGDQLTPGEVQDFSAGGLSFRCERGWRSGTLVNVRMLAPSGVYQLEAELRVIRSSKLLVGGWLVAGAFLRTLSAGEMGPFLSG